jgi:hypothetical protein
LSEYNFTVQHKPGAHHRDADGVSRLVSAAARTYQRQARTESTREEIIGSYLQTGAPSSQALADAQARRRRMLTARC